MSTKQRIDDLIQLLTQATRNGRVVWQETADENAFRLASPVANIRLARSEQFDPEIRESYLSRNLSILNDKGRIIEEFSPQDANEMAQFDALFEMARRSAYKTDKVLDQLMSELRHIAG